MNKLTSSYHCICGVNAPDDIADASPAQLAYLALNGSYGEKLVATLLLEAIVKDEPQSARERTVKMAFPKGRWT